MPGVWLTFGTLCVCLCGVDCCICEWHNIQNVKYKELFLRRKKKLPFKIKSVDVWLLSSLIVRYTMDMLRSCQHFSRNLQGALGNIVLLLYSQGWWCYCYTVPGSWDVVTLHCARWTQTVTLHWPPKHCQNWAPLILDIVLYFLHAQIVCRFV